LPALEQLSAAVQVDFKNAGGHVGFAARSDPFWLEHRIIRFLDL
jgi:predicted alpha/beta-fold hydrolase